MLSHFLGEDLDELAKVLDQCYDTINMLILWQVMNGIDDGENSIREEVVSFFSSDFGPEAGELVARLLMGAPEADEPSV
jgi:hypothetical protein